MKRFIWAVSFVVAASGAALADSVKATVGHMCCGGCKAAAMNGMKAVAWADNTAIDGTTLTVTAKAGQKVEIVSLVDALSKAGFPASEIVASGPVTFTVAHLCCGNCVSDLKSKLANVRSMVLDKDNIKIDQATKTVTLQPVAGKQLNVVQLLNQFQRTGFSASACTMATAVASAK